MKINEIPVLLLTGYLGSGKTTLLNRILGNKRGIKFAVIVNDIGEVNIDEALIAKDGIVGQQDDSLVPLSNGCICCTLKMDLVKQLSDIAETGNFDYIVIEASGICEPAPIAQTISVYPKMYPDYARKAVAKLDAIVTVVDALRIVMSLPTVIVCWATTSGRMTWRASLSSRWNSVTKFSSTRLLRYRRRNWLR